MEVSEGKIFAHEYKAFKWHPTVLKMHIKAGLSMFYTYFM